MTIRFKTLCLPLFAFLAHPAVPAHAQNNPPTELAVLPDVSAMPVIHINSTGGESDCFAIMWSGDGGWSSFDQRVTARLAANGVPVLGLNSLRYIWKAKTPESLTSDLTRLIGRGEAEFGKQKVILIGYSCGANLIPFAYNRLNDSLKAKVQYIALLSPEEKADFEFHYYNWANKNSAAAHQVKPELEKMRNKPTLFIYGEDENNAWCADLMSGMFQLRKLPGGHHFDQDTDAIAEEILRFKL